MVRAAFGLAAAHHTPALDRAAGLGDQGALALGLIVGVVVDHHPVADPAELVGTRGTAAHLRAHGVDCADVYKVLEGRPNVMDLMKNDELDLILNTPLGRDSYFDEQAMRRVQKENDPGAFALLVRRWES